MGDSPASLNGTQCGGTACLAGNFYKGAAVDDVFRQMARASELRKQAEVRNAQQYREISSERLQRSLEKKCRTTFIGAISSMEKEFGPLWGHGTPVTELTEEQAFYRERWERLRKEILDKGNAELRAVRNEVADYDVEWRKTETFGLVGGKTLCTITNRSES